MKVRKISLFNQLFIYLAIFLFLGNSSLGVLIYNRANSLLLEQIQKNVMNLSGSAAASISGEVLREISEGEEETKEYQLILEQLAVFRDHAELEYIYTLREGSNGSIEFVVDSDPEEPAAIGEECEITEAMEETFAKGITTVDKETTTDEWGTHISSYSPIMFEDKIVGAVGIDISASWIEEQMEGLRNLIILCCFAVYIVSLFLLRIPLIKFKKGIRKLNNKVEELAGGSGDLTKKIDIESGDELEVIAGNMNKFIDQIHSLVKEVAGSMESISDKEEELSSTVNENTDVIHGMSLEIQEINGNMKNSAGSGKEISAELAVTAKEFSGFVDQVEVICEEVEKANENAKLTSRNVNQNKRNALDSIQHLQERMNQISKEVQQIEHIKKIAEEISHISAQTRILSLNAQIEAARAGAMGAGFAVVATEVGTLSREIDQAIAEINNINQNVLTAVEDLTHVSEEMIGFVSKDVVKDYDGFSALGEEYEKTTEIISSRMRIIGEQGSKISRQVSESNEGIQEIVALVSSTAESADKLAEGADKLSDSMEYLNTSSQNNSQRTKELKARVNMYRY